MAEPVFDTVIAMGVIEHIKAHGAFLGELVLRFTNNPISFIVYTMPPHPRYLLFIEVR